MASKRWDRMANAKKRLPRLLSLRKMKAPAWIIKSEQVALVLNREGLRAPGIGSRMSRRAGELYEKHVIPLMEG